MANPPTARPATSVQIIQTSGSRYVPPSALYTRPKPTITGIVPETSWWTAGQPILPMAPPETSPRGFQFLSEQNKIYTPRATEFLTFDDLRRLASYPLAAVMITEHANAVASRKFSIRLRQLPGMTQKKREQAEANDATLARLTQFFMNPNPDTTWRELVYQWITEVQTTDAPALYVRRNQRRDIAELRLIDGTMIARYIDDNGWTPTSESPAYAQLWWGIPAWDLTRDQLYYRPKNPRVYKIYGNSSTEKMARLLELGWARLELKMQWAENGTIPDGLMIVPPDAPMELVERQQAWMNAVMTGNFQRRVQLRLIQGFAKDGKDQLLFPKEKMLMDPYDEYEIRTLAVGYGVPKQRFMQQMNRASAETAQEAAEEEGFWPSEQYILDSCNALIQSPIYFNLPQYEFTYQDVREKDVVKQAQADDYYLRNGSKTWKEVRDDLGLDPYTEAANSGDLADGPLAFGQGFVTNAYTSAGEAAASKQPALPAGNEPEGEPKILPPENPKPPKKYSRREVEESNRLAIAQFIQSAKANHQFEKVHPGASINPHHFSLQSETARGKIAKTLQDHFEKVAKKIVAKIKKTEKVRKSDEDDIKKLLGDDDYWQSLWITLPPEISEDLEDAIKSGMTQGMLQLDVNISSADTINKLNAIARDEARKRAAEMVGMAYDKDGELIPNPKAQYVISDTTRDELRKIISEAFEQETPMTDLISDIQEAGAFSAVRAQMIAKTEVSRAQAGGTYATWKQTGVVKTVRWQHSNLEGVCDDCVANADEGEVEFGTEFPSGDLYPPAHPQCLVAGTIVAACDGIAAHFARPFEGEVVTISLVNGQELTITPKHPVLTDSGWLAPFEIEQGMYLPYCSDQWSLAALAIKPNDNLMPTVIEQVPSALLERIGVMRTRMPGTAEDFHGDGIANREIDVVLPARFGECESYFRVCKGCGKSYFAAGHSGLTAFNGISVSDALSQAAFRSANGIMRGLSASRTLLRADLSHADSVTFADVASRQTKALPIADEIAAANSKFSGGLRTAVAIQVEGMSGSRSRFCADTVLTRPGRSHALALRADAYADGDEFSDNMVAVGIDDPRNISERLSGLIKLTRVRDVYRSSFSGHVFNLETLSGYYSANGFILHNCRCVVYAAKTGK